MKGRELWGPRIKHWGGCQGNCPACQVAWSFDVARQRCHCGEPATGYRSTGPDDDVEYFCDEHYDVAVRGIREPRYYAEGLCGD